ncbi:hypothetical protein QM565_35420 [Geitlerinema splendidum]|jgi:hypothetical protein|nr:hypothetical protein [Geitlerinema splendidum]
MQNLLPYSFFLLFLASTTLYGMEEDDQVDYALSRVRNPNNYFFTVPDSNSLSDALTNAPSSEKVSPGEWETIEKLFLEEHRKILLNNERISKAVLDKHYIEYYRPIFSNYFNIYQKLLDKDKLTIKQIREDSKVLLEPLGQFVAVFESFFDYLKTHYRTKESSEYLTHKARLENVYFPIVKNTFTTFMRAYENYANESLEDMGSLNYRSKSFSVLSEGVTKHIFYKRDRNGFSLFTLFPHKMIGEGLFETYVPYLNNTTPYYSSDLIFFSLTSDNIPVPEQRPGLMLENSPGGYIITCYRGNTTFLPYTNGPSLFMAKPRRVLENLDAGESLAATELLAGNQIFATQISPTLRRTAMRNVAENLLDNKDSTFIPFPYSPLEDMESTYLFLQNLKQQDRELPENKRLLAYVEEVVFQGEPLDQVINTYEEELLNTYKEEEIRLQQEERRRMVAEGRHYTDSKNSGTKQSSKKGRREQKQIPSSAPRNLRNTLPKNNAGDISEKALQTARERLNELKSAHRNGSIKYRKFMQLVNVAAQGLSNLNSRLTTEINRGSHGNIQVEGVQPVTMVRPHGSAKEKSVSIKTQRKVLTNLIETFMKKLEDNE